MLVLQRAPENGDARSGDASRTTLRLRRAREVRRLPRLRSHLLGCVASRTDARRADGDGPLASHRPARSPHIWHRRRHLIKVGIMGPDGKFITLNARLYDY